jgi:hypothetical protein
VVILNWIKRQHKDKRYLILRKGGLPQMKARGYSGMKINLELLKERELLIEGKS